MATIYVRKDGDDGTGDGSTATPYLTIAKALTYATGGDTIFIGDGVYSENVSGGQFNISGNYSPYLTIVSESGIADNVIIQGTTSYTIIKGSGLLFQGVTFTTVDNSSLYTVRLYGSATNITFIECNVRVLSSPSTKNGALVATFTNAGTANRAIRVYGCKVTQVGPYPTGGGIYMLTNQADSTLTDVEIHGCTVRVMGYAVRVIRCDSLLRITGNDLLNYDPTSSDHCVAIGEDADSGDPVSGVVARNTINNLGGHSLLVGAGCNDVDIIDNLVIGGASTDLGLGIVVKNNTNIRVLRNVVEARGAAGLYAKGANKCQFIDNIVYVRTATGCAMRIDYSPVAPSNHITSRRNILYVSEGTALSWSSTDITGSVNDENVYVLSNGATFGTVLNSAPTDLPSLRAAWAGYDHPNNDRNSRIGAIEAPFAGTPEVVLPS